MPDRRSVPAGSMEWVFIMEKGVAVRGGQQGRVRTQVLTATKPADSKRTPADPVGSSAGAPEEAGRSSAFEQLLTGAEVIQRLRLGVGRKRPDEVLRHLRRLRKTRYVKVGRTILYPREDVDRLIQSNHVEALGAAHG